MSARPLKLLILGAHPDDAELHAGGLMTLYADAGHAVKMVSVTDGRSGHHATWGPALVERRRQELAASARRVHGQSETWDFPDGRLEPTIAVRERIIRELRTFEPDLVLTHRTNDYHPDHRAVGQAVQDASYMVTVPAIVPDVPILRRDPVVAYMSDRFTKPAPLEPHVIFDIGEQVERITDMLCEHASQVFEWLPYNQGFLDRMPTDFTARRALVRDWYLPRAREIANRYRDALVKVYGPERGQAVEFAEVLEISEHAAPLTAEARSRLFWFAR